ncbi:hypothetical protein KOW79_021552 [Hemibagrus wyckioides]|uniref:Uncharacterized protein n=1 Tax=Hemibagrus wyckioides TaxID=337641 RepID=A0A9D3N663_9TELE|nr:hypothetical protein KOW79_021552 [Hemibagrus wyckioides]
MIFLSGIQLQYSVFENGLARRGLVHGGTRSDCARELEREEKTGGLFESVARGSQSACQGETACASRKRSSHSAARYFS